MTNSMKAGEVVRIRVSPNDIMSAIDIVDKLKLFTHGMSLSQVVSIALKAMLESCRHAKIIETRDGFEYSKMLNRFPRSKSEAIKIRGRSIDITNSIDLGLGEEGRVTALTDYIYTEKPSQVKIDYAEHPNLDVRRLYRQLLEMDSKRSIDPENFDQQEYEMVEQEFVRLI